MNSLPYVSRYFHFQDLFCKHLPQTRSPLPNGRYLPCSRNINHYPTQTSPEYKSGKQLLPDPALPESYHVSYFTCVQTIAKYTSANSDQ